MNLALLAALLALLSSGQHATPEHPVPLAKDFDTAKCAECHPDKQEGKHVHTAVSSIGCGGCHTVETKDEVTRIGLTAPSSGELCLTCHEESKEENKHRPYADHNCTTCHDPHATDFAKQTRAGMNALCLECHGERQVQDKVQVFNQETLTADQFSEIPKIVLDKRQQAGHPFLGHPVAGGPDPLRKGEDFSCLSCHQPHAAALPRLLPVEFKGMDVCEKCHEAFKTLKATKSEEIAKRPASSQKTNNPEKDYR